MLKALGYHPGVLDAGLMIQRLGGVVLTDYHHQVAGGIKEDLIAAHAQARLQRKGFAMMGQHRKGFFFTDAVGIPCHDETLRPRAGKRYSLVKLCERGNNCKASMATVAGKPTEMIYDRY